MYPGRAAQLGKRLFKAFHVSGSRLSLHDDTDDGNVTAAGISPTMPTCLSPPRPEPLVTTGAALTMQQQAFTQLRPPTHP
eukprot:2646598-Rhodomonas_salina.1